MNQRQYLKRHIELTNQLNFAAERRSYDPDFYNDTIKEIEALQSSYRFGLKVKKYIWRFILWLIALLCFVLIIYTVIKGS